MRDFDESEGAGVQATAAGSRHAEFAERSHLIRWFHDLSLSGMRAVYHAYNAASKRQRTSNKKAL